MSEVRGSSWEEQPHVQGGVAAPVQESLEELLTPRSRSGGAAVRRYSLSKVRSSGCALLEQHEEIPHVQGQGWQPGRATPCPSSVVVAGRSYPPPEARGGGQEEQLHVQGAVAARA